MIVIIITVILTGVVTISDAATNLCNLQNDYNIPLGEAGVNNCSIIVPVHGTLNIECRPPMNLIDTPLDSVLHSIVNGVVDISVRLGGTSHTWYANESYVDGLVILQCGFCMQNQSCNLQQPSYLSDSISIITFSEPRSLFSTSNGLSVTLNWTPSQISISSFPVSYRVSITTVINLSTDIDIEFNADTTETSMTFQSCDLQEPLAIDNKMYYWSIYAIVDNKISSPVKAIGGFTFNRNDSCTDGSIRLIDGSHCNEGRVEACVDGEWGTVCDDRWEETTANIACNSLGIPGVANIQYFGPGTGDINLDNVMCTGTELSIFDCPHSTVNNCGHDEDVGLVCDIPPQCEDGDIRLVDSTLLNQGRIEVCSSNVWGTVCDDFFQVNDAIVACRQLGSTGFVTFYTNAAIFGPGENAIILDNLACNGNESSLFDCTDLTMHDCEHNEDVGIVCVPVCNHGDVRLVNGDTQSEGIVEVCFNNGWGTICDTEWSDNDAMVVCNQLNITSNSTSSVVTDKFISSNIEPVHLLQFNCSGTEDNILDCISSSLQSCPNSQTAAVICDMMDHSSSSQSQIVQTTLVVNTASLSVEQTTLVDITTSLSSLSTSVLLQVMQTITVSQTAVADGSLSLFPELIIIGGSVLVVFTALNIFIVSITCFVIRKNRKTLQKASAISHQAQLLLNNFNSSPHSNNNYDFDHGSTNQPQSYELPSRERTDTDNYDTIRQRIDSFTNSGDDNEPVDVLLYNSLYESTKREEAQQQNQQEEVEEEGYYSSVIPDYSKATTRNNDGHTAIDNQLESVNTTDRDNVVSMIESDRYSSVYNYPIVMTPSMIAENTVTIKLETAEPSDDQKTELQIITMNDNDAYNLGSPDSQSISADTAVSQSRNSVQTAVSLIDDEDALSDNPLYQSYSDMTGFTTQLWSNTNNDIDDDRDNDENVGVFLQPNKAYAVTNSV